MKLIANILKLLLIACTLGYTNAWAFEWTFDNVAQQHDEPAFAQTVMQDVAPAGDIDWQHGGNDDLASHGCDHCCHATAHLLALNSNSLCQHVSMSNRVIAVRDVNAVSHISLPDSPPPKSLF